MLYRQAMVQTGAAAISFCDGRRQSFRCAFGNDSFLPHCAAMQRTSKPLIILEMPGIGLDIDNPHDLDLLMSARWRHQRATAAALVEFQGAIRTQSQCWSSRRLSTAG